VKLLEKSIVAVCVPLAVPTGSILEVFCVNVAETDVTEFIVTEQDPVPLQAPPQPLKLQPEAGAALKVTPVPLV